KDFDTCLDELLAERPKPHKAYLYEDLYGPTVGTVDCTCSRGYDHQQLKHPGDEPGNKTTTAELNPHAAVTTENPLKGTVMNDAIPAVSEIADPGAPTPEQRADSDLYDEWEAADDAWREQFHP